VPAQRRAEIPYNYSSTHSVLATHQTVMAWRVVCELLLLSKFVSLSVIPENRRLLEAARSMEDSEGTDSEARAKRSLHYLGSEEEEDESVWEAVCPTVEHRRPVVPMEDDQGNRVFRVASVRGGEYSDYSYFVKTRECAVSSTRVGGALVRCEQQYTEQRLVVYTTGSTTELFTKTVFIDSGCEAKMISQR